MAAKLIAAVSIALSLVSTVRLARLAFFSDSLVAYLSVYLVVIH